MLRTFRVHNFRSFLNLELEFSRRHLLIGKNNSGKSNLCSALRFLGATSVSDYPLAQRVVPGALESFCHRSSTAPQVRFECICELPYEKETLRFHYELGLAVQSEQRLPGVMQPALGTKRERLVLDAPNWPQVELLGSDGASVRLLHEERYLKRAAAAEQYVETRAPRDSTMLSKLWQLDTNRRANLFKRFLGSVRYYSLSPPLMRVAWAIPQLLTDTDGLSPILHIHGENLPHVLFRLKNEDEPRYRAVLECVKEIDPDLDSLNFFATPDNKPIPYLILRSGGRVSWENLSDGTLCLLALATVLKQTERYEEVSGQPALNLIEEPENSLYIGTIQTIWERLSSFAPRSQVVFTSHSPYFIDLFDRDLDSVTRLKKEGDVTTASSLRAYEPRIRQLREDFSLGELHFKDVFG